jgi:hypothetical protein
LIARLIVLGLLVVSCGGTGDTVSAPSPTPAIGDACLVGRWLETKQYSPGNFGLGTGERFEVTGLEGLLITYSADGAETDDYSRAKALNGGWRGNKIQVVITGAITYQVHADSAHIVQSKPVASLSVAYYANGAPLSGGTSSFAPATITYTCNGSFLHLATPPTRPGYGPQTDDLTRD